jgi:hypothetical protein
MILTFKKMKTGKLIKRLKVQYADGGSTEFSEATLDEAILNLGYLPVSLELPLAQYLEACELPYTVQREDGVYYKGVRLVPHKDVTEA